MEYDEHEDQEEGIEIQPPNYDSSTGRLKMGSSGGCGVEGGVPQQNSLRKGVGTGSGGGGIYRYRECLKNHAVNIGAHAVDGCTEFMAAGEEGTLDALKCAACDCHRNFHRKESEGEGEAFHHPHPHPHPHPHAHYHQYHFAPYYRTAPPAGYLHVTPPHHQRPLALPSTSRDEEDISNPSSSGGAVGGSGSAGGGGGRSGSKKRFRTKFTQDQKDKMLEFAERVGWRIQKQDEEAVQQFCCETGVKRHVLKVWMHNNKHTLGKKL